MPRMTAKYREALLTARRNKIITTGKQPELYERLQKAGWFWDSKAKTWDYHDPKEADKPSPLLKIRVWTDLEIVGELAEDINALIEKYLPYDLIEKSITYPNTPPQQLEGRVYTKFYPKRGK